MIAVRIRSWHILDTVLVSSVARKTLCGRVVPYVFEERSNLPGNEPTCERCSVLAVKRGLA